MNYLGPARIFSTDNPVSDAMQIEAEQGLWDEDDLWEDEIEVDYLFGSCTCGWRDSTYYYRGIREDYEAAEEKLLADHEAKSPDCTHEPVLG